MRKVYISLSTASAGIAMAALLNTGCDMECGDSECIFNDQEWTVVQSLSPLPDPEPDPTNKYHTDDAAAALGKKFFFEPRYSGALTIEGTAENGGVGSVGETGLMGCHQCHMPESWFVDTRSRPGNVSLGVKYTTRNTPSIVNAVYYTYYGWGGKQDSLWTQASLSPESNSNSRGNRCGYAHIIYDYYRDEYNAIFDEPLPTALSTSAPDASRFPPACKPKKGDEPDGPWEMMTEADRMAVNRIMANQGKAVAAYEARLISRNAPFDQYVAGDTDAISDAAKRGLKLFIDKAACIDCHNTPFFADGLFHNIGVPQVGPNIPDVDTGRYGGVPKLFAHTFNTASVFRDGEDPGTTTNLVQREEEMGNFKTVTLRNVAMTGPYMHTGGIETLREVVEFYNDGGAPSGFSGTKHPALVPLGLTDMEMDDLVAFLETLTGEPIPAELIEPPGVVE